MVGRPRKEQTEVTKARNPSYVPPNRLGQIVTPPGYKARWVSNDPDRINYRLTEGYQFVNKTTQPHAIVLDQHEEVSDGNTLSSAVKKRELVGMMIPDEKVKEREEYYGEQTSSMTRGIVESAKEKIRKSTGAETYTPSGHEAKLIID